MDEHYESMLQLCKNSDNIEKRKVGVFSCGAPPIGYELADHCRWLTVRGREDKSYIYDGGLWLGKYCSKLGLTLQYLLSFQIL